MLNIVVAQTAHSATASQPEAASAERKASLPSKLSLPQVDFEGTLDDLLVEVNKEMLHCVQKVVDSQYSLMSEVENLTHELHDADSLMKFKQEIFGQSQSIGDMENVVAQLKEAVEVLKRKVDG